MSARMVRNLLGSARLGSFRGSQLVLLIGGVVGCGVEVDLGPEAASGEQPVERAGLVAGGGQASSSGAEACEGSACCPPKLLPVFYSSGPDLLPDAAHDRCHVTLEGPDAVMLQPGPEGRGGVAMTGPGADLVVGCGGADLVRGGPGSDSLWGDGGADELFGGPGADALHGDGGADVLDGGAGWDAVYGGAGADVLSGGPGWDGLFAGPGADVLDGGPGADVLHGDGGADLLRPGPGVDAVFAGAGDDRVEVFASCELGYGEVLAGGPGYDVLVLPVPLADAEALGVHVYGFEEVVVEPHPCRSSCTGAVPGVVPCGPGTCEDTGGEAFACTCPERFAGPECETCAEGYAGAACDGCAPGFHDVGPGSEGAVEPPGIDLDPPSPEDLGTPAGSAPPTCVPDETCDGVDCGLGTCAVERGVAVCTCPVHRTGVDEDGVLCGRCEAGYEPDPLDPAGPCVLGDVCAQERCGGRGTCVEAPAAPGSAATEVACACDPGYAGAFCQVCAPGHHGVADEAGGVRCEPDEACTPETCSGHGTCTVEGGVAVCTCDAGYFGADCSRTCIGNTCQGAGTCVELPEGPTCHCDEPGLDPDTDCATCRPGYVAVPGDGCVLQDGCDDPNACAGHGTCTASGAAGHDCACDEGYAGATCDACAAGYVRLGEACVAEATCDEEGCGGHGTCQVTGSVATCACDDGFYGTRCQLTNPPTRVVVAGHERSLGPGQSTVLEAELEGIADFERDLVWTLVEGGGTLTPNPDGTATYTAPGSLPPGGYQQARVRVAPGCCAGEDPPPPSPWPLDVPVVSLEDRIQVTRAGDGTNRLSAFVPAFAGLERTLIDYMWDRCVGALSVAVQRDGQLVYAAGFGRTRGAPTTAPSSDWDTRCQDAFDAAGADMDPGVPVRIGSSSKFMVAAMVRWAVRTKWPGASDADVENLRLCDDHPQVGTLLPERLRGVLCGLDPLPVPPGGDDTPPAACAGPDAPSVPCYNGGTCLKVVPPPGEPGPTGAVCACADGFSGARCRIHPAMTQGPPFYADPRWQQVTLGHLMNHHSGYPGTASQDETLGFLVPLRGYGSDADLQAAEAAADAVNPADLALFHGALQTAREIALDASREAYFVPQVSLEEVFLVTLRRGLHREPGSAYEYMNGNFSLQHVIVEHLTGLPFAPRHDLPGVEMADTALGQFLVEVVGVQGASASPPDRIAPSQMVWAYRQATPEGAAEPLYRAWADGSWVGTGLESKQPDCVWTPASGTCDVGPWLAGPRYGWAFDAFTTTSEVPLPYRGTGLAPGQGAMAVEPAAWVRLLKEYTVRAHNSEPYARPRNEMVSLDHTGSLTGGASYEVQFGGSEEMKTVGDVCATDVDCPAGSRCLWVPRGTDPPERRCVRQAAGDLIVYRIPEPDSDLDRIPWGQGDEALQTFTCQFPAGVDAIVAVAQRSDPNTEAEGVASGYAGGRLRAYLLHGLCLTDWSEVSP